MNHDQLLKLKDGDIIRSRGGLAYTVLRNTGQVVIAVRTQEIHNGAEWELVYTTTPVPATPAGPDRLEMIRDIENRGWIHQTSPCCRWATPDGYFYYDLNAAYASRDLHPTASALAAKKRLEVPNGPQMVAELDSAGWRRVGMKWQKPGTSLLYPYNIAWRILRNVDTKPAKSFGEARDALRNAGWVNVGGKVWRAPSGGYFDGTHKAYSAMTSEGRGGNPS